MKITRSAEIDFAGIRRNRVINDPSLRGVGVPLSELFEQAVGPNHTARDRDRLTHELTPRDLAVAIIPAQSLNFSAKVYPHHKASRKFGLNDSARDTSCNPLIMIGPQRRE